MQIGNQRLNLTSESLWHWLLLESVCSLRPKRDVIVLLLQVLHLEFLYSYTDGWQSGGPALWAFLSLQASLPANKAYMQFRGSKSLSLQPCMAHLLIDGQNELKWKKNNIFLMLRWNIFIFSAVFVLFFFLHQAVIYLAKGLTLSPCATRKRRLLRQAGRGKCLRSDVKSPQPNVAWAAQ